MNRNLKSQSTKESKEVVHAVHLLIGGKNIGGSFILNLAHTLARVDIRNYLRQPLTGRDTPVDFDKVLI